VKKSPHPYRDVMLSSPESAVWLLYADLVRGLRWRRHAVAVSPPPAAATGRWYAPPGA
jgi:hypothetical protein